MKAQKQIVSAAILGTQAFKDGKKNVPAWDKELMGMLTGRRIGKTPKDEASSIKIMKTWSENWNLAKLNTPII